MSLDTAQRAQQSRRSSMPTCCSSSWGGSTIWLASLISPRGEVSATSSWREAFHGDLKRERNKNKNKLDHSAFWRFSLKTIWHGEQSGIRRCFGFTASYPAALQTHPKCPFPSPCLSHLFLIKWCLPWIGIFATRQEIWEDLISFQGCLSISFKHHRPSEDAGLSKITCMLTALAGRGV